MKEKLIQEITSKMFFWNLYILNFIFILNKDRVNIDGGWFHQLIMGTFVIGMSTAFIVVNIGFMWREYKVKQYMGIGIKTLLVLFSTFWIWTLWSSKFNLRFIIFTVILLSLRFILKLFKESEKQKVEIANIVNYARYSFTMRRYEIYLLIMGFLWSLDYGSSKDVYIDYESLINIFFIFELIRIKDFDFEKVLPFNKKEKALGVLLFIVIILGMNFVMLDMWKYLIVNSFTAVKLVWLIPLAYEIMKLYKRNKFNWDVMLKEFFND